MSLFSRYRNFLIAVFLIVFLTTIGLFCVQWRTAYRHEIGVITEKFNESAVNLDHVVDSTIYHLQMLRATAEEGMQLGASKTGSIPIHSEAILGKDGFYSLSLPTAKTPSVFQGMGEVSQLEEDTDFAREVDAVFRLNAGFKSAMANLKSLTWAYYTSAKRFINLYPYNPEFEFEPAMMEMGFFRDGLPEKNPQKQPFWTEAYYDLAGRGLMVTAAVPVYDSDDFRGTVSLDLTLGALTRLVKDFSDGKRALLISGSNQQLLAHPRFLPGASPDANSPDANLNTDKDDVETLASGLPEVLRSHIDEILASPSNKVHSFGAFLVIHQQSRNAPWHLIAVVPKRSIYGAIAANNLIGFLIPFLGLIICLVFTSRLLDTLFVGPAFLLIEHINQERRNESEEKRPIPVHLPSAWHPSFESISKAFAENRRLLQALEAQLAETVKSTKIQLAQGEKMSTLGRLVAGVAHEINNPVGFVRGNVSELERNLDDLVEHLSLYQQQRADDIEAHAEEIDLDYLLEDTPKILGSMMTGCDRIQDISNSLRTFARVDQDNTTMFDLKEGLESTLLILKHRLKGNERRPKIVIEKAYGALPSVECFPGQLNQVFMNILANAIDMFDDEAAAMTFEQVKANPQKIWISTVLAKKSSLAGHSSTNGSTNGSTYETGVIPWVEIHIRDNGKGMTSVVKERIFDADYTTKDVGKGTGLGLAISREIIVEKHKGELTVTSSPGEGTEFCIRVPVGVTASKKLEKLLAVT